MIVYLKYFLGRKATQNYYIYENRRGKTTNIQQKKRFELVSENLTVRYIYKYIQEEKWYKIAVALYT